MAASSARTIAAWNKNGRPVAGAPIPALFTADALDAWMHNIVVGIQEMTEQAAVEALQQAVTQSKQRVLAEQSARSGGIPPLCRQVIDGVAGAPLSAIKPDSLIVLVWVYTPEVCRRIYEALQQRSPRKTGRYIEEQLIFVDGEPAGFQAITLDTREVRFVAAVPYARRLEVGKDAQGRPWVKQVAPHIVEETAIIGRRKFADLALVKYEYVDLSGSHTLSTAGMHARHFEGGRWRQSSTPRTRGGMLETQVRYPSILIQPIV